jgi:hypothetical protein
VWRYILVFLGSFFLHSLLVIISWQTATLISKTFESNSLCPLASLTLLLFFMVALASSKALGRQWYRPFIAGAGLTAVLVAVSLAAFDWVAGATPDQNLDLGSFLNYLRFFLRDARAILIFLGLVAAPVSASLFGVFVGFKLKTSKLV